MSNAYCLNKVPLTIQVGESTISPSKDGFDLAPGETSQLQKPVPNFMTLIPSSQLSLTRATFDDDISENFPQNH